MKKLLAIFLLVAGLVAMVLPLFGQAIQFTAAVPHTNGTPSGTPSTQGSRLRYDKTNQILYQWTGSTWTRVVGVVTDADKGDITVSSTGTNWQLDASSVGNTEIASGAGGIYKGDGSVSGTTTATVPGSLRFNTGATGLVTLGDYGSVGLGSRLTVQSSGAQLGSASYEFRAQPDDTYTQMISPGYTVRLEPTTGYTLIQSGATNGYKFWDVRATPRGVEYNTDYSATYSDRSLVDFGTVKALVSDSLAAYTLAKTLTATASLNFPSTAAATCSDLTITVSGAADGNPVSIGVPGASVLANGSYSAWVSASNTVTVRFCNHQAAGSLDPASGTFRATVLKY